MNSFVSYNFPKFTFPFFLKKNSPVLIGGTPVATGGNSDRLFKTASTGGHWCFPGGLRWSGSTEN